MKGINKDNYEAFYLDFLEGNLGAEDTFLLNSFLDTHPEYRVEMEDFFPLKSEVIGLDTTFKNELKIVDLDNDSINEVTIDTFLIGELEGVLTDQKRVELNQFLKLNPAYCQEQQLYTATRISPDLSKVYEDKTKLKHQRTIPLFPIIFTIAAGFVLFISLQTEWFSSNKPSVSKVNLSASNEIEIEKPKETVPPSSTQIETDLVKNELAKNEILDVIIAVETPRGVTESIFENRKMEGEKLIIATLPRRKTRVFTTTDACFIDPEKMVRNVVSSSDLKSSESKAVYGFQDMINPIEPITDQLSHLVKREVDFRTGQKTTTKVRNFYLKIGKLVISKHSY